MISLSCRNPPSHSPHIFSEVFWNPGSMVSRFAYILSLSTEQSPPHPTFFQTWLFAVKDTSLPYTGGEAALVLIALSLFQRWGWGSPGSHITRLVITPPLSCKTSPLTSTPINATSSLTSASRPGHNTPFIDSCPPCYHLDMLHLAALQRGGGR